MAERDNWKKRDSSHTTLKLNTSNKWSKPSMDLYLDPKHEVSQARALFAAHRNKQLKWFEWVYNNGCLISSNYSNGSLGDALRSKSSSGVGREALFIYNDSSIHSGNEKRTITYAARHEMWHHSDLVKVGDDLIEEPQTLQSFFIDVTLRVELFEVRHRGKHHTYAVIWLIVQVLEKRIGKTHAAIVQWFSVIIIHMAQQKLQQHVLWKDIHRQHDMSVLSNMKKMSTK